MVTYAVKTSRKAVAHTTEHRIPLHLRNPKIHYMFTKFCRRNISCPISMQFISVHHTLTFHIIAPVTVSLLSFHLFKAFGLKWCCATHLSYACYKSISISTLKSVCLCKRPTVKIIWMSKDRLIDLTQSVSLTGYTLVRLFVCFFVLSFEWSVEWFMYSSNWQLNLQFY